MLLLRRRRGASYQAPEPSQALSQAHSQAQLPQAANAISSAWHKAAVGQLKTARIKKMAARKPPQQRLVLALDCDCFYAQCETRRGGGGGLRAAIL